LALVFSFAFVSANPVKLSDAHKLAVKVLGVNTLKSSSAISLKQAYTIEGDTLFYIFANADGGFAIISADDAALPVIGYSKTSNAGNIFENVSFANQLQRYGKIIALLKKSPEMSSAEHNQWQFLTEADSVVTDTLPADSVAQDTSFKYIPSKYLITSTWGQEGSYNDSCPSYVGCVAVAMGQIMRYHQWPNTGRGWHKYIPQDQPEYGLQFADFGSTTYKWELMPDRLRSRSTMAEKQAVQQMLYHVGVSVSMSYTKEGSGAYETDAAIALCSYFKYDNKTMKRCCSDDYTAQDWFSLIKNEIDCGRPVLYSGANDDEEGHAWIVDGYDENGFFHVNWGWDGDYDGFFAPGNMLLETSLYNNSITAIIGIQPSADVPLMWTQQASAFKADYRGIVNISAVDNLTAWASAFDGNNNGQCMDFCRTTDGGESWDAQTIKISGYRSYSLSMISAISAYEAWAAVYVCVNSRTLTGGKILHTTDGGRSWTIQESAKFSGSKAFPNIIHFWDKENGVCIGDPNDGYFEIYTTTDGGDNWVRVSSSNIPANKSDEKGIVAYYSVCGDVICFSTSKGRLYRSADRGASWTVTQTPLSDSFVLAFRNDNVGVIKGGENDNFAAYQTTDGGSNWTSLGTQSNFYSDAIAYIPGSDTLVSAGAYVNGEDKLCGLSYSTDDGVSFTDYADFYSVDMYTALAFSPDGTGGWAGSFSYGPYFGGMYHRGETPIILANTDIVDAKADTVKAVIVYPNPANGFVVLSGIDKGQVSIYNSNGLLVLKDTDYESGTRIDISRLPSGLYVLQIKNDDIAESVRLIIE